MMKVVSLEEREMEKNEEEGDNQDHSLAICGTALGYAKVHFTGLNYLS